MRFSKTQVFRYDTSTFFYEFLIDRNKNVYLKLHKEGYSSRGYIVEVKEKILES